VVNHEGKYDIVEECSYIQQSSDSHFDKCLGTCIFSLGLMHVFTNLMSPGQVSMVVLDKF